MKQDYGTIVVHQDYDLKLVATIAATLYQGNVNLAVRNAFILLDKCSEKLAERAPKIKELEVHPADERQRNP